MKSETLKKMTKGFTLIELIVVMGIIGILVVGLLAAINPVEQINRATDSGNKTAIKEIGQALLRYQAATQAWPYADPAGGTEIQNNSGTNGTAVGNLVTSGDLKAGYTVPAGIVFWTTTGTTPLRGCFVPSSKSVKLDPNSNWTYTFGTPGTAPAATCTVGATSTCKYCVTFN